LGVVSRCVRRKDKNDNPFWDMTVMDAEGQIDGKVWGSSEWQNLDGDLQYRIDPLSDERVVKLEGKTIGLQGKVVAYRDQNQYNFNTVYYVDQEKYPPHSFVRRSPVPFEAMEREFRSMVDSCGEPVRGFLDFIFFKKNVWKEFSVQPAAVALHHAYVNGLLEHSLCVARSAVAIARSYVPESDFDVGMDIDADVVLAGALLHDLGKLEAYRLSPVPEVTLEGNTAEHIVLGYHKFMKLADEYCKSDGAIDKRTVTAIGHIIVSHHGSREFGSPVLPETPEAMIVAAADDLDFKLYSWREHVSQLEGDKEMTDFVNSLQRRLWKVH
jgi:3'-5' exoribonuclease